MRAKILLSKALPILVFPYRCRLIVRHLARNFKDSIPWLFKSKAFFDRRIGWYSIVRTTRPSVVVETGAEKGLGSLMLAEALLKNRFVRLITIDMEPSSGLLIGEEYGGVIRRVIDDSLSANSNIDQIDQIDLFIHDSDHSAEHEAHEFDLLSTRLSDGGIVLSDNSHVTTELTKWSFRHGRRFIYFAEQPLNHWYPGAGIGVSMKGL
jgi:predicted O-methyltransferase YrrM